MKLLPVVGENYEIRNSFLKFSLNNNDSLFVRPEVLYYSAKVKVESFPIRGIPLFRCYGEGFLTLISPLPKILPLLLAKEEVFVSKGFMAFKKKDEMPYVENFFIGRLDSGDFEYYFLKGDGLLFLSSHGFIEIESLNGEKRVERDNLLLWKGQIKVEPLRKSELSLKGEGVIVLQSVENAVFHLLKERENEL